MKSDWVVLGIAGTIGLIAIADRPQTPPSISPSTVPSQASPRAIEIPSLSQPSFSSAEAPVRYRPLMFKGYECTVDCSGHEAGYQWAEEKGIDDPEDCGGNSESFIEGCRAYAEEQQGFSRSGDLDSDRDDGDDDDEDS